MDGETSGVSDAELFDMLFGVAPKTNNNNNLDHIPDAPTSPCYNSSMSEPGYGLIERWEPGEIVDQDFEMSTSLSSSSSPVRSYQHRYRARRNRVSNKLVKKNAKKVICKIQLISRYFAVQAKKTCESRNSFYLITPS